MERYKSKKFSSQLKISHVHEELEALDKAVNDFIEQNDIGKVISVSDVFACLAAIPAGIIILIILAMGEHDKHHF